MAGLGPPILILVGVGAAPIVVVSLKAWKGRSGRDDHDRCPWQWLILSNELAWKGLTIYHAAGGVLLILLSGSFILPRQWQNME